MCGVISLIFFLLMSLRLNIRFHIGLCTISIQHGCLKQVTHNLRSFVDAMSQSPPINSLTVNILLADDDIDDCNFFKKEFRQIILDLESMGNNLANSIEIIY